MARLDNLTLRERVHEHLKAEILANHYPPGSELLEVPLSEELGVSRGPIREALRSLESEGLVEITPRRGVISTRPSDSRLRRASRIGPLLTPSSSDRGTSRSSEPGG